MYLIFLFRCRYEKKFSVLKEFLLLFYFFYKAYSSRFLTAYFDEDQTYLSLHPVEKQLGGKGTILDTGS